jgi:hypothetical protein
MNTQNKITAVVPVTQNEITTVVHDYSKQTHYSGA